MLYYAFHWSLCIVVPGLTTFLIIGNSVAALRVSTISIYPKTGDVEVSLKQLSSICTIFPGPPSLIGLYSKYLVQISRNKLNVSMTVTLEIFSKGITSVTDHIHTPIKKCIHSCKEIRDT